MIDANQLHLPDTPPEWKTIPPEILARLSPDGGIFTPAQRKEIDRIASSRWFLVRNETSARCKRCSSVHRYLTYMCVERPFNGLTEVVGVLRQREGNDISILGMKFGTIVPISDDDVEQLKLRLTLASGNRY